MIFSTLSMIINIEREREISKKREQKQTQTII